MKTLEQLKSEGFDITEAELASCVSCWNVFYSLCPQDDVCCQECYDKKFS